MTTNHRNNLNDFSLNEKLIFEGDNYENNVTPETDSNDAIIFPSDDNDVNYDERPSGETFTYPTDGHEINYNLNALCIAHPQLRFLLELNSNATSGSYTFPNGTQIVFARCQVVLIKHPD